MRSGPSCCCKIPMSAARPSPSYSDRIDRVSEYAISWDSLACTVAVASCKGEPFPSILLITSLRRDRRDRQRDKHADSSRNVMAETGPMPSDDLSGELGSSPQSGHLPDTNHIDPFVCLDLPCAKYAAKSIRLMCGSLPIASRLAPAPLVKPHMALTWPHDWTRAA